MIDWLKAFLKKKYIILWEAERQGILVRYEDRGNSQYLTGLAVRCNCFLYYKSFSYFVKIYFLLTHSFLNTM